MHTEARIYQDEIREVGRAKTGLDKAFNYVGQIFSAGLSSVKIVFKSVEVFLGMADSAESELSKAGLGATAGYFRIMIGTVVLILLFVGILLAIILGKNKL